MTVFEYRYKKQINGDRAEAIKRDVLLKYPFPEFAGERFMSESVLFDRLGEEGYKFRWFNSIIKTTDYLIDGLASNMISNQRQSPFGTAFANNLHAKCKGVPLREKLISACNYYRYGLCGDSIFSLFLKSDVKFLSIFAIPMGILLKLKDEK